MDDQGGQPCAEGSWHHSHGASFLWRITVLLCATVASCCHVDAQDFEKGFIMAEVMSFDGTEEAKMWRFLVFYYALTPFITDFKANGSSEATVRAAGRLRMEGRGYEVQDGDIIHVRKRS